VTNRRTGDGVGLSENVRPRLSAKIKPRLITEKINVAWDATVHIPLADPQKKWPFRPPDRRRLCTKSSDLTLAPELLITSQEICPSLINPSGYFFKF
jgi:hypothetical protein